MTLRCPCGATDRLLIQPEQERDDTEAPVAWCATCWPHRQPHQNTAGTLRAPQPHPSMPGGPARTTGA